MEIEDALVEIQRLKASREALLQTLSETQDALDAGKRERDQECAKLRKALREAWRVHDSLRGGFGVLVIDDIISADRARELMAFTTDEYRYWMRKVLGDKAMEIENNAYTCPQCGAQDEQCTETEGCFFDNG